MITAAELRIGNILTDNAGYEGTVLSIDFDDRIEWSYDGASSGIGWFELPKLRAVPLTEKWLTRLGFEPRGHNEYGNVYGVLNTTVLYGRCVGGGNAFFLNGYHNDVHLRSVHQLQNLYFALTGEELTEKTTVG